MEPLRKYVQSQPDESVNFSAWLESSDSQAIQDSAADRLAQAIVESLQTLDYGRQLWVVNQLCNQWNQSKP